MQELLESFRPGTYIYQPFQKESIPPTLIEATTNDNDVINSQHDQRRRLGTSTISIEGDAGIQSYLQHYSSYQYCH